MYIDIDCEKKLITEAVKQVSGYQDCERIIIQRIRKQVENGAADSSMEEYLKNITSHLETSIDVCGDANIKMNYRYVIGFINTLLRTPSWRSWMQTIQV
jgi:hypothetical protein